MNFESYLAYFESIVRDEANAPSPYDNPEYFQYTKLNWSRMNRWLKTAQINADLQVLIASIDQAQHWIVITEPWCGDAAHSVPFIELFSRYNEKITVSYELRDNDPHRIEAYLSNGSKSIPIIVCRDENDRDLAVWGPRPAACQALFEKLKAENVDMENIKTAIQHWYNEDKGQAVQADFLKLLQK